GMHDLFLAFSFIASGPGGRQLKHAQYRAGPSAEVFGRELLPSNFGDVFIHVGGIYDTYRSIVIYVLEQLIARQVLAPFHDMHQTAVRVFNTVLLTTFAPKMEKQFGAGNTHMPVSHGG